MVRGISVDNPHEDAIRDGALMKSYEIAACLTQLSVHRKAEVLATVAHYLTVAARGAYPSAGTADSSLARMLAYNEALHQLSNQIESVLRRESLYPDDVFIHMLVEDGAQGGCERQVLWAFEQVLADEPAA